MDFTDQDMLNFLSPKPIVKSKPTIPPPQKQFDPDQLANEFKLETQSGGTGIPEYQSNLKEIWNGFRQGTASVVDSLDSVVNLVSKATGLPKGGAFEKLRDYINPTPEELEDKNFGATLLRAIGAAGPIIAEFAVGTKGAGKLLQAAKLPQAIKGIATAPVAAFGGIEGLTAAGRGGTAPEVLKETGKGALMGATLGAAGLLRPALQVPTVGGVFGGMAALEGGDTQEIAVQTLVGLGFGAHGAIKSAKKINMMKDWLTKQGYNPEVIDKLGGNKLWNEFTDSRSKYMSDYLLKTGMAPEEVVKLKGIELEREFLTKEKVLRQEEGTRSKSIQEAIKADPEALATRNKQAYNDFLVNKGFNPELLKNVSNENIRELAMAADPEIWKITPDGKIKQVEKKVKKEKIKQSIEELQKEVSTATSQAAKEKAQVKLAKKEADTAKLIKEIEEAALKEREQKIATEPEKVQEPVENVIKTKMKLAISRAIDDWNLKDTTGEPPRLTVDEFEALRDKFAVPEANREELFREFKDEGISIVEKKVITDEDMAKLADKAIDEGIQEEAKPKIPHYVKRAFYDKKKKIINEGEWNALSPGAQEQVEKHINTYYNIYNKLIGQERAYEEWRKAEKKGRLPKAAGTSEGRKVLALQAETARKALRALLGKEGVRLTKQTQEAEGTTKKEKIKLKTPLVQISPTLKKHLIKKLSWTDELLNKLSNKADITAIRKNKYTPEDVEIDEFGRIVPRKIVEKKAEDKALANLAKTTEDDVLRGMGYSQEEIDATRGVKVETPVKEVVKETVKVKPEKPVKNKGPIKTLEDAELAFNMMKNLEQVGEEPGQAEIAAEKRIGIKKALEQFVGKKNLSDDELWKELEKRMDEEAEAYVENIKNQSDELDQSIIIDEKSLKEVIAKEGPPSKPDTGEINADELVAKAYARARNATPLEKSAKDFAQASDRLYKHQNQITNLRLAIKDPSIDPDLKVIMEESIALMEQERPKIAQEVEANRKVYTDIQISTGIPKERTQRYNGPIVGETNIEGSKQLGDGTGGLFVSEGGQGVDRFYLVQDPSGGTSPADSKGNKIAAEIRLVKSEGKPGEVELQYFKTTEGLNPVLEDTLLSTVIDKYTKFGQAKIKGVKRIPGVGDSIWDRRDDVEKTVRKPETQIESKENTRENINNNNKTHGYVNWLLSTSKQAGKGIKEWKQKYEQRQDLLESMSTLKQASDPQQFDPERFRAEIFPEYDRMLGFVELTGDPTLSKNPIIRPITQKFAQVELNIQDMSTQYEKKLYETFQSFMSDRTKQEAFWKHTHKVKTSIDPEVLDAYEKYRFYKEELGDRLGAKERGWYIEDYGTIKYDMNKVWDIMKEPFKVSSTYAELNSRVQASLNPDMFNQAKNIAETYKTWDSMPKPTKDWVQQNIFNFHGVWSGWEYLPEFLQRSLPKKFFVANMQARTAGEALKGALDYDFFDIERGYIRSVIRGALMNDALMEVRPLINQLPNASKFGSVRNYLEKYVKVMAGNKPTILDPFWNSMANSVNEALNTNLIPLYFPSTVSRSYIPQLYRGLLGPDTALRNLTQIIYGMANSGGRPVLKGVFRYIDERRRSTPEFKKFEELISLPDEFLELGKSIRSFKESKSTGEQIKYINGAITRAALWPMKFTEHVNKGVAYFAGLEEAAAKGYDLNTAHIVGTAKASRMVPSLELTEAQYKAFRSMGGSQFLYTAAHTSPYLQGAGMKMLTPFWSFPLKTIQLMWNNLLLNPIGGKTDPVLMKKDYTWLRFMALTGFMATAPIVTSNLFGTDTKNIWGKGLFPMTIMPAWMEQIGNIYKSAGGDPGSFTDTQKSRDYLLRFVGQITIPWYRWGGKVHRNYLNAERGYREYGREARPIVETSYLDEIRDAMGFPSSKFREAQDLMKEFKDEKSKNMLYKHYYLYKAVDAMQEKDYDGALQIIKDAKKERGVGITPIEVQQAIDKKKMDIWWATKSSAPGVIRKRPGFQAGMEEARRKFMPSKARSYGTKPMWSSLSETIEQTTQPTVELEE